MQDRKNKAIQSVLAATTSTELVEVFDELTTQTPPAKNSPQHLADILAANAHAIDPEISDEQLAELMGATLKTVIGPVRFGANQLDKLGAKGRVQYAGWIRPTLENPLVVLKERRGTPGDERDFNYLFVNAIAKPDGKVRGFVCVTVQKAGDEVVVSSHHIKSSKIGRKMQEGDVVYRRPGAVGVFLESVGVEGNSRTGPLELRTGRPTTDAPDTSIAPGDSSVAVNGLDSNYLDAAAPLDFIVLDVQFEPLGEDEFDHGRVSYVATVKGASVRTAFKLIEANALIASNGLDGKPNGAYPQELQPRDRTRVASVMQITKLSRSLQPARLADSGLSSQGAPIIGPDKVVESGNGRSMAIIKAYAEGNAGEYRQYLEDNAELYGFTPTQVKAFSSPVLVRVRLDEVDRAQFAKDSNVSDMQAMSPTEQARIDAEAMDEGVMALFSPGASGDFLAASNRPFVSAFLAKLTSEQAAGLLTPDGRPTKQVIDRIRAAVFAKAYQHEDLLRLAVEEPDPEIRNVLSALTNAAPQFVTMRTLSGEAHKQTTDALVESVSLTKTLDEEALSALVDATTIVRAARDAGQSVEEYLKQGDMFGGADPQAAALASFIAANNRSVKRMAEAFTVMAEEICQILEHKGQVVADMFGEPPVDLVTVLARVNDHMAELYGEKGGIKVEPTPKPDDKPRLTNSDGKPIHSTGEGERNFLRWFGDSMVTDESGKPQIMYHGSYRDFAEFDRLASTRNRPVSMDTVGLWFSDNPGNGGAGMYASGVGAAIYPVYLKIRRPKVYHAFSDFLLEMHEANGNRLEDMNPPGIGSPEALREKLKGQGYDGIAFTKTSNQAVYDKQEALRQQLKQANDEYRAAAEAIYQQGEEMTRKQGAPYQAKIDQIKAQLAKVSEQLENQGSTEFDQQTVWVAFDAEQVKSATGNTGAFDPASTAILDSIQSQARMFDGVAADLPTQVRAARAARIVRDAESVGQVVALFDMMTSNKEGQFERDAGEFERQIRALSLSVITRPREEAITDAAIRHMNKQQVLAELDRNPEYQALTPAQREGLSDVMARSAGNIVDAGGFHYDIRTYEAVTAYIEQQRGQPGYQEAVSAAVSLYRHYAKLLRESGNKPLVQGVAPLRAMVDELTGVMPEREAAKMVAGTKVRISAASLAPGYDMATMKSDMARFYQVVSGQMGTPELVRKKKRAYASLGNNHINSGEGMTKTTLWHEMGHFVEYKNPELLLAAKQLLARRSDAIPSEKGKVAYLKHMTGVKSYKNEVAVNDGFYHPYVGKIYGAMGIQGVETTEVFSMGFQALTTDVELAKLAMADPEHLAMVMAAIKMLGIKYKEAK